MPYEDHLPLPSILAEPSDCARQPLTLSDADAIATGRHMLAYYHFPQEDAAALRRLVELAEAGVRWQ